MTISEVYMVSKYPLKSETGAESGYPAIEELLANESFDELNQALEGLYKEQEALYRAKMGLKKGKEAKKVMVAIERVNKLLKELLEMKAELERGEEKR
jgi:hypothetical protein